MSVFKAVKGNIEKQNIYGKENRSPGPLCGYERRIPTLKWDGERWWNVLFFPFSYLCPSVQPQIPI